MATADVVQQIIDNSIERANEAQEAAIGYGDDAQTAAIGFLSLTSPTAAPPSIPDPPFPVDQNFGTEFTASYNDAFANYDANFNSHWQTFIDTFFPEIDGCIPEHIDAWICNTIENGGTGLPAAIEDAIYDRGQSRELKTLAMKQDDIVSSWAARGFSLPAGALQSQLDAVYDETSDKLSTLSRDVLIKNKEIEIENVRFAIEQGNRLRIDGLNAAVNYVRAWFLVPQTAVEKARALMNMRLQFYQAINAYYNALVSKYQIIAEYAKANLQAAVSTNNAVAVYSAEQLKARVAAAVGSADALGRIAASAFGALNTLANLGDVTVTSKKG
jgi:hypothetical protein